MTEEDRVTIPTRKLLPKTRKGPLAYESDEVPKFIAFVRVPGDDEYWTKGTELFFIAEQGLAKVPTDRSLHLRLQEFISDSWNQDVGRQKELEHTKDPFGTRKGPWVESTHLDVPVRARILATDEKLWAKIVYPSGNVRAISENDDEDGLKAVFVEALAAWTIEYNRPLPDQETGNFQISNYTKIEIVET